MIDKFKQRIIIDRNGIPVKLDDDNLCTDAYNVLLEKNDLMDSFQDSYESRSDIFLVEQGYVILDLRIGLNMKIAVNLLYLSKNLSNKSNELLFDLFNEDTRKEKLMSLVSDKKIKYLINKTSNIYVKGEDLFNRLPNDAKKELEEEIEKNGISAGVKKIPELLPLNKKNVKLLKNILKE